MWEQLLAALSEGGGAAALEPLAAEMAMTADPSAVAGLLGGQSSFAPKGPGFADFLTTAAPTPGSPLLPQQPQLLPAFNNATSAAVVGPGNLTPPPEPKSFIINGTPAWTGLTQPKPVELPTVNPPQAPAGLTADQISKLMAMGAPAAQEQAPRVAAAPQGQAARPPGAAQMAGAVQSSARPSLADLIYRRR